MRLRFLFMMLFVMLTGLAVSAQQQEPFSIKPRQLKPFQKIAPVVLPRTHIADSTSPQLALVNSPNHNKWYQQGSLIDSVSMGKVYRMPIDNMHCLVPDATKTAQMPVKKTRVPERMPNTFSMRGMNNGKDRNLRLNHW